MKRHAFFLQWKIRVWLSRLLSAYQQSYKYLKNAVSASYLQSQCKQSLKEHEAQWWFPQENYLAFFLPKPLMYINCH